MSTIKRSGRDGVVAEFRYQTTDALLWEAPLQYLPQKDDIVTYSLDGATPVEYEVKAVKFNFQRSTITVLDEFGQPIVSAVPEVCAHEVVVYVLEA